MASVLTHPCLSLKENGLAAAALPLLTPPDLLSSDAMHRLPHYVGY
jgi:hypothetical protein